MYVRIATVPIKQGMLDELSDELVRGLKAAALSPQPAGFLGVQLLENHEANKIAIVSRWATQADEAADRQGRLREQEARLGQYMADKPVIEGFELNFEI
jgi:heme-degrading monooxygenase HmoA